MESGSAVEYDTRTDPRSGKTVAVHVKVVARPTSPPPAAPAPAPSARIAGRVVRELRGARGRPADAYGGRVAVEETLLEAADGGAAPPTLLDFTGADLTLGLARLAVGERVTFVVVRDAASGEARATSLALALPQQIQQQTQQPQPQQPSPPQPGDDTEQDAPPRAVGSDAQSPPRESGRVQLVRDTFGFVRVVKPLPGTPARIFFHNSQACCLRAPSTAHHSQRPPFAQVDPAAMPLAEGCDVSFHAAVDARSGKITAHALRAAPRDEPPAALAQPPQPREAAPPSRADAASWARAAPQAAPQPPPPAAAAAAADGSKPSATNGDAAHAAPGGTAAAPQPQPALVSPAPAPPVPLSSLQLPASLASLPPGREMGTIVVVKEQYGFIKCCTRPQDLFFHFSSLEPAMASEPPPSLVGCDVTFSVSVDSWAGGDKAKPIGVRLARAPPGSAVFEAPEGGGARVHGVCREKAGDGAGARGRGAAGVTQPDGAQNTQGIIELLPPDEAPPAPRGGGGDGDGAALAPPPQLQPPVFLPYLKGDVVSGSVHPRAGDCVSLSIVVDLRSGARRCAGVRVPRRAGTVTAIKKGYGFIQETGPAGAQALQPQPQPQPQPQAGKESPPAGAAASSASSVAATPPETAAPAPPPPPAPAPSPPPAPSSPCDPPRRLCARLFFHSSEVEGGVPLKEGDEVEFVLCTPPPGGAGAAPSRPAGPQDRAARRLKRTREAPPPPPREEAPPPPPRPAPPGGAAGGGMVRSSVRIVDGPPPGAKGFVLGRGKPLLVFGPPPLRPTAAAFVPGGSFENLTDLGRFEDA